MNMYDQVKAWTVLVEKNEELNRRMNTVDRELTEASKDIAALTEGSMELRKQLADVRYELSESERMREFYEKGMDETARDRDAARAEAGRLREALQRIVNERVITPQLIASEALESIKP